MKRGMSVAALCFGIALRLIGADEAPKSSPNAASGKPKIKFDQTTYDFGKTSQVERVTGTFTFQNVGDGVLKMGKPSTSCGCTVAGVKPEILQPGEKGELTFTLNLPKTRAILQKQITVDSNDPDTPKTVLTVKADYTPLYDIAPISFYFNLHKGDATNISARVTRTDTKPFQVAKITPSQPWIEAKAEPEPSSTNHAMRISATVKPDGAPRYFSEFLTVFVEGSEQPAFNVTFSGRLLGDLTLSPESLYWPITDPQKALTLRKILVRSSLADKLEVKNVSSSLQNINVDAVPNADGKTVEIVAKLASVPDRTTNGVIRLETNVPSQPKIEVPVYINIIRTVPVRPK
jgi:hypothetical protein